MKIAIYHKEMLNYEELKKRLLTVLEPHYKVEFTEENPEYVFTFGGDGTFLDAVTKYGQQSIYVPINMGNLGFYTSWKIENLDRIIIDLAKKKILKAQHLKTVIKYHEIEETFYAINDITIINPLQTLILTIKIDDNELEPFRGTGLCFSTPTGSTAYNKSLGGAIISPNLALFQLTAIAPINNTSYRTIENSIVLGKNNKVTIEGTPENFAHVSLVADRKVVSLDDACKLEIELLDNEIKILTSENLGFWKRVHKSFVDAGEE